MHAYDEDALLKAAKPAPAGEQARRNDAPGAADVRSPAALMHLQRKVGNAGVAQLMGADDDRRSIEEATSAGHALDPATRVQMEGAFGADFSGVRVHTGGAADQSAAQLGAHAYTVGDDVVFANGRYEPDTPAGQRTLAHELTHVVQQRSGPVDGTDTGGGVKVSHPSDRYELAAESMADQVVANRVADVAAPTPATGPSVQREDAGEEEEVQQLAIQREGAEAEQDEEEVQTLAIQREGDEEDEQGTG